MEKKLCTDKLIEESATVPSDDVGMEEAENLEEDSDSSEDWHTVKGDEYDEKEAIPFMTCLFCLPTSSTQKRAPFSSLDSLMPHMLYEHGFQLPDYEFCTDLPGLLAYLGQKIGCGKTCIWCGQHNFRSTQACQKHMSDKNHSCFSLEGTGLNKSCKRGDDHLIEYMDFYDYSSLYATDGDADGQDTTLLFDEGAFLVLPSGARIGHRSLMRYFRQSLKPLTDDDGWGGGSGAKNPALLHGKILAVSGRKDLASYGKTSISGVARSFAGGQMNHYLSTNAQLQKRARDMAFMKRKLQHFQLKQGMNNMRLFKSRGRDDQQ